MESLSQDFAEMRREMELLLDTNKRIIEAAQKAVREIAERDAALAAKDAELARMREALGEIIDAYEWCSEDPYDRGYSVTDDAIRQARAALRARSEGEGQV